MTEQLKQDLTTLWSDFSESDNMEDEYLSQLENRLNALEDKVNKLPDFVERTYEAFESYTTLTRGDMGFLMLAVALQSARQVLMNIYKERLSDKEASKKTLGHKEEHSNRSERRYYASIEDIVSNPVPFDSVQKEDVVKRNQNPKLSGMNHRYKALGHDPYLGFIFGTANIMTSTITITE